MLGIYIRPRFKGQAVQLKMPQRLVCRDSVSGYWEAGKMLINSVVDSLKGPLLILVVAR
jgi:hypothetical protein